MTIELTQSLHTINDWDTSLSSKEEDIIPETFRQAPSPTKHGFISWLSRFINYLSGTHGEKLSCSQLNTAFNHIFTQEEGWETHSTFAYGDTTQPTYLSKKIGEVNYVISAACHDLPEINSMAASMSGGRAAVTALGEIKNAFSEGEVKVLMPIAQSNNWGFSFKRGHFVLFEVNMRAGIIESSKLHDAKGGLIDHFYTGAAHLKKQLLMDETLGLEEEFIIKTEHHGHQSLLNGNDCGRYSAYYASTIVKENDLANADCKTARAFFMDFF